MNFDNVSSNYTTKAATIISQTAKLRNNAQFFLSISLVVSKILNILTERYPQFSHLKPFALTLKNVDLQFTFEAITLPKRLIDLKNKQPLINRLISASWSITIIGCVLNQFKTWNLLDTAKLAQRIGKFRCMGWLPSQDLTLTLRTLCCCNHLVAATNAGHQYFKKPSAQNKEAVITSIAFFIFHGICLAEFLKVIQPPNLLIDSVGIGAYSIYACYKACA